MIVISLSSCSSKVRGYLSEWFFEISTGVYVGNVTARVRDEVWETITQNIGTGRCIMAYSTNNERGMCFQTWNTGFVPIDYDGVWLVKQTKKKEVKKSPKKTELPVFYGLEYYQKRMKENMRKAGKHKEGKDASTRSKKLHECGIIFPVDNYTVIDLETCGLKPDTSPIIEIGAVKVRNHRVEERFHRLIRIDSQVNRDIVNLTGITNHLLEKEGVPILEALLDFLSFVGSDLIAGHNVKFDIGFLKYACHQWNIPEYAPVCFDSWVLSKQVQPGLSSYRLSALLQFFHIADSQCHRALQDAELTFQLIEKLNEIWETKQKNG